MSKVENAHARIVVFSSYVRYVLLFSAVEKTVLGEVA
jgi:hypothetical protein